MRLCIYRMSKLRFKPAYNPYNEPRKWLEIGNSGMFRPEILQPMGLPEDVQVIAWGLSLERPTMIFSGIKNIRDLFGHKVDLHLIKQNPISKQRDELRPKKPELVGIKHRAPRATERKAPSNFDATAPAASENPT
ncbi:hypothetical protein F2Q69_00050007 [Brassica cretica]|uniref:Phenylalanyl-tRNA synthetase domain-containing protein n=1 Tax=Brassica cretica TaxID=69181 RepID=A0A8S9PZN9_BRACR|nr:hypothetical protein F2Q69_00050007 [Brassica cretica]